MCAQPTPAPVSVSVVSWLPAAGGGGRGRGGGGGSGGGGGGGAAGEKKDGEGVRKLLSVCPFFWEELKRGTVDFNIKASVL